MSSVPHCNLATDFSQVACGSSDSLSNSKALGLAWDRQDDKFCVNCKEFVNATTKREMSSQLASQFDPLRMAAPHLLGGKLILQQVAALGVEWDEILSVDIQDCWKKWLGTMNLLQEFSIPRNCLPENVALDNKDVKFQLHGFCDASNSAFCCEIYLRCLVDGKPKSVLSWEV